MPELYELKNCPIFQVGTWNGDSYAEPELDAMVEAFGQVGFKPPLKLGHDESQPLAKSDSMPALGWVANLRRVGKVLYADFIHLPKRIYELIRNKAYNRVSAEVYWEYDEQGRRFPRVLKAVALLGAEIPAVTSLQALETLYAAQGQTVKAYMDGGMMLPVSPPTTAMEANAGPPRKAKTDVNYREAGSGGYERCGGCKFWMGPLAPIAEDEVYLGGCQLVAGEVASAFICDLVEVREAFKALGTKSPVHRYEGTGVTVEKQGDEYCVLREGKKIQCFPEMTAAEAAADALVSQMTQAVTEVKAYTIEKRGDQWCLVAKSTGKTLGCHPTEEAAMAQEQAVQANKHGSQDQAPREYRYSVEEMEQLCPDCAKNMRFLNLRELKITYDPVTKTYAGFNEGLCKQFAPGDGFRTRCMESSLGANADDPGAMCNSVVGDLQLPEVLEDWRFTNGHLASKTSQAHPAKTHSSGAQHGGSPMPITDEEKTTLESRIAQLTADLEALRADSAKTLAEKEAQVKAYEGQLATIEAERIQAEDKRRRTENEAWIAKMSAAEALRLTPAERPYVEHLLAELSAPGLKAKEYTRTYTKDGQSQTETLSAVAVFKRLYEMRQPNTMLFSEVSAGTSTDESGQPGPPTSMAAAREVATARAKEYIAAQDKVGVKVSFITAYRHVLDDDAELKEAVAGVRPEGQAKAAQGAAQFSRMVAKRAASQ